MIARDPETPLKSLAGIGPKRAAALAALGYATVEDLLYHLPIRYEDRRRFLPLAEMRAGERACFLAVVSSPRLIRTRRRGFTIFEAVLDDGTAALPAVWFNQPYLARALPVGRRAYFHGALAPARSGRHVLRFENPQFEILDTAGAGPVHAGRIVPVYEKIGTLSGKMLRALIYSIFASPGGPPMPLPPPRAIAAAGDDAARTEPARVPAGPVASHEPLRAERSCFSGPEPDGWAEFLPAALLARLGLPERAEALREVHVPSPEASVEALNQVATAHHRRLIFEEFFLLQLAFALRRAATRREQRGFVYRTSPQIAARMKGLLPFKLTEGQRKVLREIVADLTSPHPMNRLLQGEVGSGKTIVAVLAMVLAAENGLQAAFMVPTELLAEQQARALRERLEPAGYRVVCLTSAVKGTERRQGLEALAAGTAHIAIGTHALVEQGVAFRRLGLIVIDEQHRFGVLQRARLGAKGPSAALSAPDTLVMTATPIPRSLAMTLYGDLDVSILDQLPPGRAPVETLVREEADRGRLYGWLRAELERGRQAFVVTPRLAEKPDSELRAATAMARRLAQEVFPDLRVGLVHGALKASEKSRAMEEFRSGRTRILVATTIIEVGIDVPDASILIIEHAERFGLSQLHQLRGRIGRGSRPGTCVLMTGANPSEGGRSRLSAMERETSGFRLAEIDLLQRGPGETFGTRQSGLPDLRVGDLARDQILLEEARREAIALVAAEGDGAVRSAGLAGRTGPVADQREVAQSACSLRGMLERIRPAWRERFDLGRIG